MSNKKITNIVDVPRVRIKEHLEKYICAVNEEGEVAYYAKVGSKKNKIGGSWVANFQESLDWIAEQGLTGEQLNVMLKFMAKLDYNNYIRISQSDLAKELHIKQPHVSRAVKKLVELDIIAQGPRAGFCKTYILNPNIGIKGRQKKQKIVDYEAAKAARAREKQAELSAKQQDQDDSDKSDT